MLIQIENTDGPCKVLVDDGVNPFEFTAASTDDAHRQIKAARKDGLESLRPIVKAKK